MYKILYLTVLCSLFFNTVKPACLGASVLKDLGYGEATDAKKIDPPTVCKNLFKEAGTCATEEDVQKKLEDDNGELSDSFNILEDMSSTLEELSKKVKEVSETEQKVVDAIKTKIDGDQQACLNALSNIQQGVTCYLASAFADKNTSVESTKIVVTVSRDKVGAELDKCRDFYDAACLVGTGTALSGDVTVSDDSFTTKKEKWGKFCEDLKAVFGDADKKETRYELLINNFKPYDFDFFPTKSLFDTAKDTLSDFAGDVKDFFSLKARLLLGEDDVELKASASSGEDVASFGAESGVDKPKVGSSSILSIITVTMIGMLIK